MIGVAAEDKLARACEERLGRIVQAAATCDLRQLSSPAGRWKSRKPERVALAVTDRELWFFELRYRVIGFTVGAVLCHLPRSSAVAHWRHNAWAWPTVWKLELSWPDLATYLEGSLVSLNDTDRLMGLLASDELERELRLAAPSPG